MAYCSLILAASGPRFLNTFRRALPEGTSEEQPLSSGPKVLSNPSQMPVQSGIGIRTGLASNARVGIVYEA
jgi:hypothetical protein